MYLYIIIPKDRLVDDNGNIEDKLGAQTVYTNENDAYDFIETNQGLDKKFGISWTIIRIEVYREQMEDWIERDKSQKSIDIKKYH